MKLVKVNQKFYDLCKQYGVADELMENEAGRPGVLLVQLTYKGINRNFVVPLRSNISGKTPKEQYLSLPPNKNTKPGNRHGVHYIKLFPIEKEYINKYVVSGKYYKTILNILDKKEPDIISSVKEYLAKCESGQKHSMTPNINGIIDMFNMLKEEKIRK